MIADEHRHAPLRPQPRRAAARRCRGGV